MGGLSIWHWLIVLVVVILIFGTKKLKSMGGDLGEAVRNFKSSLSGDNKKDETKSAKSEEDNKNQPQ